MSDLEDVLNNTSLSRRDFLRAAGVSGLAMAGVRADGSENELSYVEENSHIPESYESLTEYRSGLATLYNYFNFRSEDDPNFSKAKIGWIDSSPVNPEHDLFAGTINYDLSRSFAHTAEGEGDFAFATNAPSVHANMALQFATQLGTRGAAGFCQSKWSEVVFTNLHENDWAFVDDQESLLRAAGALRHLIDSGAGVVGIIPTWRISQISKNAEGREALDEFYNALFYASTKNVIIVVAGGNANADLSSVYDLRIPHHKAKHFSNCLLIGGVNENGKRAEWGKGGSNYGVDPEIKKPYMSFVTQATRRVVPSSGKHGCTFQNGTTFATGELTAAIGMIQHIIGKDDNGSFPKIEKVLIYLTETAKQTSDKNLSKYGLPRYNTAFTAAIANNS
jgi:hypothetical protein